MIKKLWFVRNEHRLFTYLNFAITGFTLIYSILNVLVFEDNTKYFLLIIPVISTMICFMLFSTYKRVHKRKSILTLEKDKQLAKIKISQETAIGFNFIIMLFAFFFQIDILNYYKGVKGSYIILEVLCIVSLFCFGLHQMKRHKKL